MVQRPRANRKNRSNSRPVSHVLPKRQRRPAVTRKRMRRAGSRQSNAYLPPEDWHEPGEPSDGFRVVVQDAGPGYVHVVTAEQVRTRLAKLPSFMLAPLDVVQFSRMTTKKQNFPCYGMQWGGAIYLYPLEEGLVEYFDRPPRPAEFIESRQFGGRWIQGDGSNWKLVWTKESIADFYLNNVLIHELGHLLDNRNSSYRDRERFAEWFAIEHGYKASRGIVEGKLT